MNVLAREIRCLLSEPQKYDTIRLMQDHILALTKELIAVQSIKDNPKLLREVLVVAKKQLSGYTIEEFMDGTTPSMLAYAGKQRPKRFKVILNAHLDVVPALPSQFTTVTKSGKLYGRGTNDMKAAAAVEILAFAKVAKQVSFPIGLQLVTDEEIGGLHGTKYQIDQGVRSDFVIAGEPTNFGVNNKAKGIIWCKITTKGSTGHGAYPWNGVNALWKLHAILGRIAKKFPVPVHEVWKTTINLAKIETNNTTYNKIPDSACAWLDIRYIPEDKKSIQTTVRKLVGKDGKLEISMLEQAQVTDEKNKYVVALQAATKSVTGTAAPVIVKHGGSDIRLFNEVGCDGVTFGPIGKGLHTDTEWVDIASLSHFFDILTTFLTSLE